MILRGTWYSEALKQDTNFAVVAPNTHCGPYRTAYLLHGLFGHYANYIDNTLLSVYAEQYDIMFIMPEGGRSFYIGLQYGPKYETYVTEEVPLLAKRYFAVPDDRENTLILGASMGGYGALRIALRNPEKYAVCCALSAPLIFTEEYFTNQRQSGQCDLEDYQAIFGEHMSFKRDYDIMTLAK